MYWYLYIHDIISSVSIISTCAGVNKGGVQRFNGHLYWFSWQDNDGSVANAKWDWFNARNYCRSLSRYIYAVSIISMQYL